MMISIYSVFTSFLWFSLFVVMLSFLRRKLGLVSGYSLIPLITLTILSIVRVLFPFELPFTVELESWHILPFIQDVLRINILTIGAANITVGITIVSIVSFISVVFLVRLLFLVHQKLKNFEARTQTDDSRLLSIFEQVKREAPSRRTCSLYSSENCSGPYIFGFTRSGIVLPEEVLSLSDQDLYYILKHEWQHHLNRDVSVKLFVEGLCCVLWWNPFVFLLRHNLNQTLELKCDKSIIQDLNLEQRLGYSESLLHVLALRVKKDTSSSKNEIVSIPFSGVAVKHKPSEDKNTLQRFDAILEAEHQNQKAGIAFGVCLMLLFLFSFCFVIQPAGLPPAEDLAPVINSETEILPVQVTPETSVIIDNLDGTYSLFIDGECWRDDVLEQELENEPFRSLSIITPE